MPLENLPADPPIDTSRAGRLRIAAPVLAALLNLPEGNEIARIEVGEQGDLVLFVRGKDMPPHEPLCEPVPVEIICTVQQPFGGLRITLGSFAHNPPHHGGHRWLMRIDPPTAPDEAYQSHSAAHLRRPFPLRAPQWDEATIARLQRAWMAANASGRDIGFMTLEEARAELGDPHAANCALREYLGDECTCGVAAAKRAKIGFGDPDA